jgi:hypothetical protein
MKMEELGSFEKALLLSILKKIINNLEYQSDIDLYSSDEDLLIAINTQNHKMLKRIMEKLKCKS